MTEVMIRTSQLRLMRSVGRCKENYILTELALFLSVLFDGIVFDNLQCSSACTLPLALREYWYVHVRDYDVFECMMTR